MKRKLQIITSCIMIASFAVAQEGQLQRASGNISFDKQDQLPANKEEAMSYDSQKQNASATQVNRLYEPNDQAKAEWIKANPEKYRSETVQPDVPEHLRVPLPENATATRVTKDRPTYVDTGNPDQDRVNHEKAKNKWLKKNDPEAYQKANGL